ncbi:Gut cathepsin D-like aspartic protease [Oopsacas minuta]|uniref:Gut cathepsin D-like aspartic protease n=1 Tax=Oopsacas minuta TaxID=111878 RepID=A0AAV7JTU2_9METZ|nr:Gut cathepsin D-like aspartic protease [Oopsacas minuta]
MYSRVCLFCIIITLSLGYGASKAGVEESIKKFSVSLDVINPRDRNCKLLSNHSKCDVDLSGVVDSARVSSLDDGLWLIMTIKIGAAKQPFKVELDTGSNLLWVFGDNCLDDKNEECKGHTKFVLEKATKYKDFELEYESGYVKGKEVKGVDVHVTGKITIKNQLFGAAGDVDEEYEGLDGVMGLDMDITDGYPSVIYNMIAQKLITEPAYSLYLKGATTAVDGGEITFGGRNEDLVVEDSGVMVKMIKSDFILAKMTSLKVGEVFYCSKDIDKCRIIVDSGCTYIYGTKAFVDDLHKEIGADEEDIVDCKKIDSFPTLEIMFGQSKITLESKYYIDVDEDTCTSLFEINEDDDYEWSLGVPFFVKYYIEFDFTDKDEHICFWKKK